MNNLNRTDKLLISLSYVLITVALVILAVTNAPKYNISIYYSTSFIFWIAILLSIVITIYYLYRQYNLKNNKYLNLGILSLILCNFIVIALPLLLGVFSYGIFDQLTHIGYIQSIIRDTTISSTNFYPFLHIFGASLTLVTSTRPEFLTLYLPAIISIIFSLFIYLYARCKYRHAEQFFIIIIGFLFIGGQYQTMLSPNSMAVMLIPLFLYLMEKSNHDLRFRALSILILIIMPFIHILIAFFLIIITIISSIIHIRSNSHYNSLLPLVGFVSAMGWFSYSVIFEPRIMSLVRWIEGEATSYTIIQAKGLMDILSLFDISILIILSFGSVLLYFTIFFISSSYRIINHYSNLNILNGQSNKVNYSDILFITSSLFIVVLVILPAGMDIARPIKYLAPLLVLSGGYAITQIKHHLSKRKIFLNIIITILIVFPLGLGLCSVHPSDNVYLSYQQTSIEDFTSMNFYILENNRNLPTLDINSKYRYVDAIIGVGHDSWCTQSYAGDHFSNVRNYSIVSEGYLLTNTADQTTYVDIYPTNRFVLSDFFKINIDPETNRLYSTPTFSIYWLSNTI